MTSNQHDPEADEADLAAQRTPADLDDEGDDGQEPPVDPRDDVDEGDLLEQSMPVPDDDDDRRG